MSFAVRRLLVPVVLAAAVLAGGGRIPSEGDALETRSIQPLRGERWTGRGIAYGPFRDGQFPGGPAPFLSNPCEEPHLRAPLWDHLQPCGASGPGEAEQAVNSPAFAEWTVTEGIPLFDFEACDANCTAGNHPDEDETHWGLFRADRIFKAVLWPERSAWDQSGDGVSDKRGGC
jgi:hypothetical protein